MDELAASMGTSKSIVYRYFTDKSGLQAAVGHAVLDEFADALQTVAAGDGPVRERLHSMIEVCVGTIAHSPNVYRFVTQAQGSTLSTFLAAVADSVASLLRELLGEGDDDKFATLGAAGVVGFVRGVAESWVALGADQRPPSQDMVEHITRWLWSGATAPVRFRSSTGAPELRASALPSAALSLHQQGELT